MSIKVDWKGKKEWLPGTYTNKASGFPAVTATDSAGDVMFIDTGSTIEQEYVPNAQMYTHTTANVLVTIAQDSQLNSGPYAITGGFDRVNPSNQMIWSAGKGIIGEFENNDSCIYRFTSYASFKDAVGGGGTADLIKRLFYPLKNGGGVQNLYYARACQTKAAVATQTLAGGGTFRIYTKEEGVKPLARFENSSAIVANRLKTGYAMRIVAGSGVGFYQVEIWKGTYQGSDNPYVRANWHTPPYNNTNNYTEVNPIVLQQGNTFAGPNTLNDFSVVVPKLIYKSANFTDLLTMKSTLESSSEFNELFYFPNPKIHVDPVTNLPVYGLSTTGTYAIAAGDITSTVFPVTTYIPFMRGVANSGTVAGDYTNVESFTAGALSRLLEVIIELPNSLFLCDRWGITDNVVLPNTNYSGGALSTQNLAILNHIKVDAAFDKFMFVGAGSKSSEFSSTFGSTYIAPTYDDESVVAVHSGVTLEVQPTVFSNHPDFLAKESVYTAALVCGREAGLAPQTPGTFKNINVASLNHSLLKSEAELADDKGLVFLKFKNGLGYVIDHSINTIQSNTVVLNPDGTSAELSVMRIAGILNRDMINEGNKRFVGTNIGQSNPQTVKDFVDSFLKDRTSTLTQDGLIISYQDISVHFQDDNYHITYGFVPNYPINKLFVTATILPYTPVTI